MELAGWSEHTCRCSRHGFDPWLRKIPWRRKWQPLQGSSLKNPMDGGAWRATIYEVTKGRTRLSDETTAAAQRALRARKQHRADAHGWASRHGRRRLLGAAWQVLLVDLTAGSVLSIHWAPGMSYNGAQAAAGWRLTWGSQRTGDGRFSGWPAPSSSLGKR